MLTIEARIAGVDGIDLHMTNGRLTAIHAIVTLLAVWLHAPFPLPPSPLTDLYPFCAFSTANCAFSTTRSRRLLPKRTLGLVRPGDEAEVVGAGVDVRDLRGDLVGEASDGGNVVGWLRVDTMLKRQACVSCWQNAGVEGVRDARVCT